MGLFSLHSPEDKSDLCRLLGGINDFFSVPGRERQPLGGAIQWTLEAIFRIGSDRTGNFHPGQVYNRCWPDVADGLHARARAMGTTKGILLFEAALNAL